MFFNFSVAEKLATESTPVSYPELSESYVMKCKKCGESCNAEQYPTHSCIGSSIPLSGTVEPVVCPQCGKTFKNKNSLKVHKSMYHRLVTPNSTKISSGIRLSSLVDIDFKIPPATVSKSEPTTPIQPVRNAPVPQVITLKDDPIVTKLPHMPITIIQPRQQAVEPIVQVKSVPSTSRQSPALIPSISYPLQSQPRVIAEPPIFFVDLEEAFINEENVNQTKPFTIPKVEEKIPFKNTNDS